MYRVRVDVGRTRALRKLLFRLLEPSRLLDFHSGRQLTDLHDTRKPSLIIIIPSKLSKGIAAPRVLRL